MERTNKELELIHKLLEIAVKNKASDLHLCSGMSPFIRIDGEVKPIDLEPFSAERVEGMLISLMNESERKQYKEFLETDFAISLPTVARFRVNAFRQMRGSSAVFRTIPSSVLSLDVLDAPRIFTSLAMEHRGLILVTGPTGSGKSTTLAAMVNHINENRRGHILTIEDPIEFVHVAKSCIINQRELGRHTHGFEAALRSALREDPDVILVGEMRDLETIRLALTAAETGHLVLATLHTSSAAKSVNRIIDVFPGNEKEMIRTMLSESLVGVISQVLLRRLSGSRVAAWEVMINTPAIKNLIRENKVPQLYSVMQTSQSLGMQTMDQCMLDLAARRIISIDTARNRVFDKTSLEAME